MKFEDAPDEKFNLQESLLKNLPETNIKITQQDIQSLIENNPSENLIDYWNELNDQQKEILRKRAEQLYRPAK